MNRYANRKDANHTQIKTAFESMGHVVHDLSDLPETCDIVVQIGRHTVFVEIKDGSKPPSKRKLTSGEIAFRDKWLAGGGNWEMVKSQDDAIAVRKKYLTG